MAAERKNGKKTDFFNWMGHVGFFIRQENNMWWILGGCQGGLVSIRSYRAHKVLGIRRMEKSKERFIKTRLRDSPSQLQLSESFCNPI